MTPDELAALHALCFTDMPRPWTAGEFEAIAALASTLAVARPEGFALGRVAGPEAELLTLAVHPAARRRGVGRALVRDFEAVAAGRGAREVFLEVAVTNLAAQRLYDSLGYRPAGRRAGYYARAAGPAVDALVLAKVLGAGPGP
jgi:ribosomal-protein-alanine N-acetyltransferase